MEKIAELRELLSALTFAAERQVPRVRQGLCDECHRLLRSPLAGRAEVERMLTRLLYEAQPVLTDITDVALTHQVCRALFER